MVLHENSPFCCESEEVSESSKFRSRMIYLSLYLFSSCVLFCCHAHINRCLVSICPSASWPISSLQSSSAVWYTKSAMGWQLFGNFCFAFLLLWQQSQIFQSSYLPVNVISTALFYPESLFIVVIHIEVIHSFLRFEVWKAVQIQGRILIQCILYRSWERTSVLQIQDQV